MTDTIKNCHVGATATLSPWDFVLSFVRSTTVDRCAEHLTETTGELHTVQCQSKMIDAQSPIRSSAPVDQVLCQVIKGNAASDAGPECTVGAGLYVSDFHLFYNFFGSAPVRQCAQQLTKQTGELHTVYCQKEPDPSNEYANRTFCQVIKGKRIAPKCLPGVWGIPDVEQCAKNLTEKAGKPHTVQCVINRISDDGIGGFSRVQCRVVKKKPE